MCESSRVRRCALIVGLQHRLSEAVRLPRPAVWYASRGVREKHAADSVLLLLGLLLVSVVGLGQITTAGPAEPAAVATVTEVPADKAPSDSNSLECEATTEDSLASDGETSAGGAAGENRRPNSRAWYIFSQVDCDGLLHGLPLRLGEMMNPDLRSQPPWTGVDDGGRVSLNIRTEGEVAGPITVGLFNEARWWKSRPVQVRQLSRPGRHTLERMIPGEYCLGAISGEPDAPNAYGIHEEWPKPVSIAAGQTANVEILVSTKFRNRPGGHHRRPPHDEAGEREPRISVRTFDEEKRLLPYCRVNVWELRDGKNHMFHDLWTDYGGFASMHLVEDEFRILIQRFDFDPERFAELSYTHIYPDVWNAKNRPILPLYVREVPQGPGIVRGRVVDQFGAPLTEYYLSLSTLLRGRTGEVVEAEDWRISLPVTDADGRFEVTGLAPATYAVMVRHFDYPTHVWDFNMQEVTIPDADERPVVETTIKVEAKERRYGRAVYKDGKPFSKGIWTARFERPNPRKPRIDSSSLFLEEDGSFCVSLSQSEKEKLNKAASGMIDVYAHHPEGRVLQQVAFSELSSSPNHPLVLVFREP